MPARLRLIKSDEPGERFRADARPRLWGTAACAACAVALLAAGHEEGLAPLFAGPLAAAFVLWASYLLVTYLSRRSERYTLSPSRLTIERGVLSRSSQGIELWRVREVLLEQTALERLRGAGRITVLTTDAARPSVVLGPLGGVRALHEKLSALAKPQGRMYESR